MILKSLVTVTSALPGPRLSPGGSVCRLTVLHADRMGKPTCLSGHLSPQACLKERWPHVLSTPTPTGSVFQLEFGSSDDQMGEAGDCCLWGPTYSVPYQVGKSLNVVVGGSGCGRGLLCAISEAGLVVAALPLSRGKLVWVWCMVL